MAQRRHRAWRSLLSAVVVGLFPWVTEAQSTRTLVEDLGTRVERLEQIVQGQALLELLQRVETLSALSREQRGELDVLRRELEILRQQQRDVMVDQERRLAALEQALNELRQRAAAADTTGSAVDSTTSGLSLATDTDTAAAGESAMESVAAAAAPSGSPAADSTALGTPETAEVLYARALASLNSGAYPAAIAAFEVFLQQHAEHPLSQNARYWIGQAYFLLRDYSRALEFFSQVGPDMVDVGKVSDAWLKRGLSELELGRREAARASFEVVTRRYPDSAAAPLARQTLARMAESSPQ